MCRPIRSMSMSLVGNESFSRSRMHPARRGALSIVLWAFGLSTSLFLLGTWGRTVAVDTATIQESTATVIDAGVAKERIDSWFEDGLALAAGTDSDATHAVAEAIRSRPEYTAAVDAIVGQFIDGLFAPDGSDPVVDIRDAAAPLVPVVLAEFAERNVVVDAAQVEGVLDAAGSVELGTPEAATVAAVVRNVQGFLTQVLVVALAAMLVFGLVAVYLADRRFVMVRTLGTRVVIAATSYALILRIASWALDPQQGRSSIAGGGAVLLGSNGQVFLILGSVAALVAVGGGLIARRRKQATSPDVVPEDDDTKELVSV
ncbi:MAG: hypothetical protein BMS9Abin17_1494 [Acidimicrobiia bacterium]|nr:MAG: hypothetical protein BMS9Abin17_1494 [Acidimicrobiia bacterium]